MTQCPAFFAFDEGGNLHAVQCGQWSCPNCAKHLARLWAWRCRLQVEKHGNTAWFWTLTLRGKYHTAEQGYKALPRLWDNIRKRVQRAERDWSYCAFVEGQPQRDYMPHFHAISLSKAPCRLKDLAMECGFGYQAKESYINSAKAANYCAKYASKTNPATPKGFRRVRASRDWAKLPAFEGEDRKSTRLNSSHQKISYAVFCLKKKKTKKTEERRPSKKVRATRATRTKIQR